MVLLQGQLGPYRIDGLIGEGGMGTVYRGHDVENDRPVAVKVLATRLSKQAGFRARFAAEIESLRKLEHPRIVRLYGLGETKEGLLYYGMELVDGPNLEDEIAGGRRFGWRETLRIGSDIAEALRHAHDRGIIHRDLKPANLIRAPDERVKLSDFGIARLFGNNAGLTMAFAPIGTAHYMSPEQVAGKAATPRSDLYSLGCTLYALLTGRPPFVAATVAEVLRMQSEAQPIPVRRLHSETPEELEAVIHGLMAKDPESRFASAGALMRSLAVVEQAVRLRHASHAPPSTPRVTTSDAHETLSHDELAAASAEPEPDAESRPDLTDRSQASQQGGWGRASAAVGADPHGGEPAGIEAGSEDEAEAPVEPFDHFITAEQASQLAEEMEQASSREAREPVITGGVIAAVLIVAVLVGMLIWLLRPPPADALYERIIRVYEEDGVAALKLQAQDIALFQTRYPDDPRNQRLRELEAEIDLYDLERQLDREARRLIGTASHRPIEMAYFDAIQTLRTSPELGREKLRGLIMLYGSSQADPSGRAPAAEPILQLAARQLAEFEAARWRRTPRLLRELHLRLDEARRLDRLGERDAADRIIDGVVLMYGRTREPWARELLERVRDMRGPISARAASAWAPRLDATDPAETAVLKKLVGAPASPLIVAGPLPADAASRADALRRGLVADDPTLRWWALRRLQGDDLSPEFVAGVLDCLQDADADNRAEAANALARLVASSDAVDLDAKLSQADPEAAMSIESLSDALRARLHKDGVAHVRWAAAEALAVEPLSSPAAIEAWSTAAAEDSSPEVRQLCALLLERVSTEAAAPAAGSGRSTATPAEPAGEAPAAAE